MKPLKNLISIFLVVTLYTGTLEAMSLDKGVQIFGAIKSTRSTIRTGKQIHRISKQKENIGDIRAQQIREQAHQYYKDRKISLPQMMTAYTRADKIQHEYNELAKSVRREGRYQTKRGVKKQVAGIILPNILRNKRAIRLIQDAHEGLNKGKATLQTLRGEIDKGVELIGGKAGQAIGRVQELRDKLSRFEGDVDLAKTVLRASGLRDRKLQRSLSGLERTSSRLNRRMEHLQKKIKRGDRDVREFAEGLKKELERIETQLTKQGERLDRAVESGRNMKVTDGELRLRKAKERIDRNPDIQERRHNIATLLAEEARFKKDVNKGEKKKTKTEEQAEIIDKFREMGVDIIKIAQENQKKKDRKTNEGDGGKTGGTEGDEGKTGGTEGDEGKTGGTEGDEGKTGGTEGDEGKTGGTEGDEGKTGGTEGDEGKTGDTEGDKGKTGDKKEDSEETTDSSRRVDIASRFDEGERTREQSVTDRRTQDLSSLVEGRRRAEQERKRSTLTEMTEEMTPKPEEHHEKPPAPAPVKTTPPVQNETVPEPQKESVQETPTPPVKKIEYYIIKKEASGTWHWKNYKCTEEIYEAISALEGESEKVINEIRSNWDKQNQTCKEKGCNRGAIYARIWRPESWSVSVHKGPLDQQPKTDEIPKGGRPCTGTMTH